MQPSKPRTSIATVLATLLTIAYLSSVSVDASVSAEVTHTRRRTDFNENGMTARPTPSPQRASEPNACCGGSRIIRRTNKAFAESSRLSPILSAFIDPSPLRGSTSPPFLKTSSSSLITAQQSSRGDDSNDGGADENVKVGSSEYYKGFVSRGIDEEPTERITGDAVLGPTLKFVGGAAFILVMLTVGFLASNGII